MRFSNVYLSFSLLSVAIARSISVNSGNAVSRHCENGVCSLAAAMNARNLAIWDEPNSAGDSDNQGNDNQGNKQGNDNGDKQRERQQK